jgi:hypothetical protein
MKRSTRNLVIGGVGVGAIGLVGYELWRHRRVALPAHKEHEHREHDRKHEGRGEYGKKEHRHHKEHDRGEH